MRGVPCSDGLAGSFESLYIEQFGISLIKIVHRAARLVRHALHKPLHGLVRLIGGGKQLVGFANLLKMLDQGRSYTFPLLALSTISIKMKPFEKKMYSITA